MTTKSKQFKHLIVEPVRHEHLSAAKFKKLLQEKPFDIKTSVFVPPTIGERGFGRFEVEYTVPKLRRVAVA